MKRYELVALLVLILHSTASKATPSNSKSGRQGQLFPGAFTGIILAKKLLLAKQGLLSHFGLFGSDVEEMEDVDKVCVFCDDFGECWPDGCEVCECIDEDRNWGEVCVDPIWCSARLGQKSGNLVRTVDNSSSRADTLASGRQKRVFLQGIQDLFESQRSHQRKNDRTFLFLGIKDFLQDLFQGERERFFIEREPSQNSLPTIMIGDGSQNSFQTIMFGDEMPNPFSLMGRTSVSRSPATRLVNPVSNNRRWSVCNGFECYDFFCGNSYCQFCDPWGCLYCDDFGCF